MPSSSDVLRFHKKSIQFHPGMPSVEVSSQDDGLADKASGSKRQHYGVGVETRTAYGMPRG